MCSALRAWVEPVHYMLNQIYNTILTCVVDTKLTGVTGWFCVCPALDSDLSTGWSTILTGVGLLTMDPLVLSDLSSRFSAWECDTYINFAPIEVGGIFSIGQKAVAIVTGVLDPLGVGGFDEFDAVFPSWYISGWSSSLLSPPWVMQVTSSLQDWSLPKQID